MAVLKLPLLVLCLAAIALTTYYFAYVTDRRSYLVARDFRLLATIGQELEGSIASDRRTLKSLLTTGEKNGRRGDDNCGWSLLDPLVKECISHFIPILRTARVRKWPADRPKGENPTVGLELSDESSTVWRPRDENESEPDAVVRLELADVVDPILNTSIVSTAFDTVLVASTDGRVLVRSKGIQRSISRMDKLSNVTDPRKPVPLDFDAITRSPGMVDIEAFGSHYTLFTQPCCEGTTASKSALATDRLVLCGLTLTKTLTSAGYAAPFSIVLLASAGLLLALLSWPFLRLQFISESDRVRPHDVVLVGVCALLGLGVMAVFALDMSAQRRLDSLIDDQLERFANEIEKAANTEIGDASKQLRILEGVANWWDDEKDGYLFNDQASPRVSYFGDDQLQAYPWFESFALMDKHGLQRRKLSLGSFATSLIDVSNREYFTHWSTPDSSSSYFLDSIRSDTTGAREAALSHRRDNESLPVATLYIPMRSLIDPVIPRGFGFAVIDTDGKVLFHSDPEHKLSEDFFVESDNSRRLRALSAAKRMEPLDISYWGTEHRAFVKPFKPSAGVFNRNWTIVTFFDKDLARSVRMEWLVHAFLFLAIYVAVYVAICTAILIVSPEYRAPWIWPDPRRSSDYLDLLPPLLSFCVAFLIAIAVSPPGPLLVVGWLLPFLVWFVVYVALHRSNSAWRLTLAALVAVVMLVALIAVTVGNLPRISGLLFAGVLLIGAGIPAVRRWTRSAARRSALPPPVNASYGLVAVLFLLLTALLPAVALFQVAWTLESRIFVKYDQLELTSRQLEREQQDERVLAEQFSAAGSVRLRKVRERSLTPDVGNYRSVFFNSGQESRPRAVDEKPRDVIPEFVEELLPFYSEFSVRLRELVHDRTADGSWEWRQEGRNLLLYRPAGVTTAAVSSTVPALIEGDLFDGDGPLVVLLVWLGVIGGALYWVVRFVMYNVFLVDVIEPLANADTETWPSFNTFVVVDDLSKDTFASGKDCIVDAGELSNAAAAHTWLIDQLARIQKASPAAGVLIVHFEHGSFDRTVSEQKLQLVEHVLRNTSRTITIVSTLPPSAYTESASTDERGATPDVEWTRRWARVLDAFTVVRAANEQPSSIGALREVATAGWREAVWRLNTLGFSSSMKFLESEDADPEVKSYWRRTLPYAWLPERPLSVGQLFVEVGDLADKHYKEVWARHTPSEQLLLGQLAREGLVSPKARKTVRSLMAGGLVRRDPHFVLVSETFRRFVLSAFARSDAAELEKVSSSSWNTIRWPFFVLVVGSLAFLFATQEQLFNSTLSIVTGITAFVPAVFKLTSLFSGRTSSST